MVDSVSDYCNHFAGIAENLFLTTADRKTSLVLYFQGLYMRFATSDVQNYSYAEGGSRSRATWAGSRDTPDAGSLYRAPGRVSRFGFRQLALGNTTGTLR